MNWSLLFAKDRICTEIERDAKAIADWMYGALAAGPEYLIAALRKHGVPFGLMASGKGNSSRVAEAAGERGRVL
jgi:hypothetical protein